MPTIAAEELRRIGKEVYQGVGATPEEAATVSDLLVASNLAGHDSHGVVRIPQYVEAIENGQIKPGAQPVIERETAATAVLNGNWGFGHVTAVEAMKIAIRKAETASVGLVTVHCCNHVGRLGGYPSLAAEKRMVGLMTNNGHGADLCMAPWGGVGRILPANSLAIAFPSDREYLLALDLTTAVAAGGKVRVADARGEDLPEGWLVDADGEPTVDPSVYFTESMGALVPFGGQVGHKGAGLAIVLDALSGALSPAGCSREASEVTGNALFIQVIKVEAFQPYEDFCTEMGRFIDYVKSAPTAPEFDEVLVPGERSHRTRIKRLAEGIPVEDQTWDRICSVAEGFRVRIPSV